MIEEQDPRAWRVATALAHATGLDWARWAKGETSPCTCQPYERDGGGTWHMEDCRGPERLRELAATFGQDLGEHLWRKRSQPVPAPWDTDAYLADCRRRGVEPGPLPSLEFVREGSAAARFLRLSVSIARYAGVPRRSVLLVVIEVGSCRIEMWEPSDESPWTHMDRSAHVDDLVGAANLARVAAEAMR